MPSTRNAIRIYRQLEPMFETPHLTDAEMLRTRIREHVDSGVLTLGYLAGRDAILALLNDALATAIVAAEENYTASVAARLEAMPP